MAELRGNRCECTACGKLFGGEHAFDLHRVGQFFKPGIQENTRRCLTDEEMIAKGLHDKNGVWRQSFGSKKWKEDNPR